MNREEEKAIEIMTINGLSEEEIIEALEKAREQSGNDTIERES